jgi:site-specific recombinase XerC
MIDAPARADPLVQAVSSFRLHLRASNRSDHTTSNYLNSIGRYHTVAIDLGLPLAPDRITREHIEVFLSAERERGMRPNTLFQRYMGLRALFKWLAEEGEIAASPMLNMRAPKVPEDDVRPLADADIRALLRVCSGRGFTDRRDTAIIRLLVDSGLRLAEVAGLQLRNRDGRTDVDLDTQQFRVLRKGGKVRFVPFGAKTALALDRYLRARSDHKHSDSNAFWLGQRGPLVRHGIYVMVKQRASQANITAHPHQFRHTWATIWSDGGGDPLDLKELGGWSDLKIVERYTKHTQQERARQAHRRHSFADRF